MTPFQQLRVWSRRASAAERALTAVAVVVAVALLGWLIAPVTQGGSTSATSPFDAVTNGASGGTAGTGGTSTGAGGTTATGGSSTGSGATGTAESSTGTAGSSGTTGATGTAGSSGASATSGAARTSGSSGTTGPSGPAVQCPAAATGQGVSSTKIDIAVTIVDIAGAAGNDAVGVPSPDVQEHDWTLLFDDANKHGGAGCRSFAPHFFPVNPLSSADQNSKCLDIVNSKPFLTLDLGSLTLSGAGDCLPRNKIPLISQFTGLDGLEKYYPYYINPLGLLEDGYHNGFQAAKQNGYLSAANGFKKLGVLYWNCRPSLVARGFAEIKSAGVPDSQVDKYNLSCPGNMTPATDYQQAALTFKNDGVTHVTVFDATDYAGFTRAAAQQNYKPKYVLVQDTFANKTNGAFAPNAANLDGAIDIQGRRLGESDTPNYPPSAATVACNRFYAADGQKPVYQQGAGYGGVVCNLVRFVTGVVKNMSRLDRTGIASAMHGLGKIDNAFPWGPVDFSAVPAGAPYGKEGWRVDKFFGSCACWRVVDATFHPAFS